MVPQLWLQWWFRKLWTTEEACYRYILRKKSQILTQITFRYRKSMLPLSDWCLHGVYIWQKFWRKNISGPLATLSALQRFDFHWTPATKATRLQELAECFRLRLSPDNQRRAFAKNGRCIQILDTALICHIHTVLMTYSSTYKLSVWPIYLMYN